MTRFTALLDACVLVPVGLADTLLRVAEAGLYRPLWSERILTEMTLAVEQVHPHLADGSARARADAMRESFPDAMVTGWEPLVDGVTLPDPGDRHVVAAAVRGRADVVVTANIRDFPAPALAALGMEAQTPDTFLLNQLDLAPAAVVLAVQEQARAMRRPPATIDDLLDHLAQCGVPTFAAATRQQRWRSATRP